MAALAGGGSPEPKTGIAAHLDRLRRFLPRLVPRFRIEDLAVWAVFLFACGMTIWCHRLFLGPPRPSWLNIDEGYVTAFAERMLDGHLLPYVDAVSHRGPLYYWVSTLAIWIGGPSWITIRITSLVVTLLTMLLVFACGLRAGRPLMGALGVLTMVLWLDVILVAHDGISYNSEAVLNIFAIGALLALIVALDQRRERPSTAWCAVAGVLTTFAALSKQVAAFYAIPFTLWVLAASLGRAAPGWRERLRPFFAFAAGGVVPVVLLLAIYAIAGETRTLFYWMYTYNVNSYMAPFSHAMRVDAWKKWLQSDLEQFLLGFLGAGWAMTRPFVAKARGLARAYDEQGLEITVGLIAVAAVIGGKLTLRDFGHYWVAAIPWWGLLVGLVLGPNVEVLGSRLSRLKPVLLHLLLLAPSVYLLYWGTLRHYKPLPAQRAAGGGGGWDKVWWDVGYCPWIWKHTTKDDRIFIWGFKPTVYVTCQRRPASRFVFTSMVAGWAPWVEQTKVEDERMAAPGSRALLVADLEKTKPKAIIDAASSIQHRPMRRYEVLATYLDQHYRYTGVQAGQGTYRRGKPNRRVLFDFEREGVEGYRGWTATGRAFDGGTSGVKVPGESLIMGQEGKRLANSFHPKLGDSPVGTLTSPGFAIDRTRLAFLIGGGGQTRVELLVDEKVVSTAIPNRSEQLSHVTWDVRKFKGKQAQLRLVDEDPNVWGHILCDLVELYDSDD